MQTIIELIFKSAYTIAKASDFNPVLALLVVLLFFLGFNSLEALIEKLIWGDRFEHWLDPVFMLSFMAYGGLCVWLCAVGGR